MLTNFAEKLEEYYKSADIENENGVTRPYDRECLTELKNYQNDLSNGLPEALAMCDSWGKPYRYFGNPGKQMAKV